jgi:hypothetical protein
MGPTNGTAAGGASGATATGAGGTTKGASASLRKVSQDWMAHRLVCIWRRLSKHRLPSARDTSGQGQHARSAEAR